MNWTVAVASLSLLWSVCSLILLQASARDFGNHARKGGTRDAAVVRLLLAVSWVVYLSGVQVLGAYGYLIAAVWLLGDLWGLLWLLITAAGTLKLIWKMHKQISFSVGVG